ncbi:glycosyltransferase [Chryseobacterium sp. JJR-5R]|uniref:glycosyltransferase n=1 Tax=Chryseobacterium sp. JJR-5R TaxID=3093923 RepID=UPI002A7559B3|nr:glycosyltransferase [Chryseobacterium sp. JJR-5R]WPO83071.1 glycosyltransferase [Chryseobacterium sp. JJR-5R]
MSFTHIITTSFNVPSVSWKQTRDGKNTLTNEWFMDRIDIFDKYCLPSFKNQTNKNFWWIVFFDVNTPEFYKERIKEIEKEFPRFKPYFVNDHDEKNARLPEIILEYTGNSDFLITTDVDNDDILHMEYVETIQRLYQPVDNLVIDLRRGLQLTHTSGNKAFITEYYSVANPFVSLVESVQDFKTVTHHFHHQYRNFKDIAVFDEKPLYIQFIHQNNLANKTFNNKRFYNINFNDYGLKGENHFKISFFKTLTYNLKRYLNFIIPKRS